MFSDQTILQLEYIAHYGDVNYQCVIMPIYFHNKTQGITKTNRYWWFLRSFTKRNSFCCKLLFCNTIVNVAPLYMICTLVTTHSIVHEICTLFSLALSDVATLAHWGRDKMDAISQTIFSSAFSWMKMFELRLKFHWNLFLRVQLTIFQHWFR